MTDHKRIDYDYIAEEIIDFLCGEPLVDFDDAAALYNYIFDHHPAYKDVAERILLRDDRPVTTEERAALHAALEADAIAMGDLPPTGPAPDVAMLDEYRMGDDDWTGFLDEEDITAAEALRPSREIHAGGLAARKPLDPELGERGRS